MQELLLEMKQITKKFPGVLANDNIKLSVKPGEIHMLLGENGSGKSTLMNILAGLYKPDIGEMYIKGNKVNFKSPRDAINAGVGMVHQHFKLVDTFTVAENIILGTGTKFKLNAAHAEQEINVLASKYGLAVDPTAKIWQLSVGEKQRVEILKALYKGSDLLILDEPTAVLTPQETRELFQNLRQMTQDGRGIVVITHKLQEVMDIADRVTVLRAGKAVATLNRDEITEKDLAWLMVGRDVVFQQQKSASQFGVKVLELNEVQAMNDNSRPALQGVTMDVKEGEIFGIAGVAGNGQRELAEVITGMRTCSSGSIYLDNKKITNLSPQKIIRQGVSHVPEDRMGTGLVPKLGSVDNIMLKGYRNSYARGPFLDYKKASADTDKLVSDFNIKLYDPSAPVSLLSGGNLQKLLLAREMSLKPLLLVAVYPVRGLDVGATETVHRLLLEQRARGTAILLISEDLDEIFKLSDRVGVIFEGQINGIINTEHADLEEIGLLMMGAKQTGDMP
ncbi:MAG: ABC transporter ATP-binding protein [Firmicutes bacterium]|nr:ABC transporter ATP-binding protein [Bacillota bacterium]